MRLREQFGMDGAVALGDTELLTLVVGTGAGGRSAIEIAADALSRWEGLEGVSMAPLCELAAIKGMGQARAIRVQAGLELGQRIVRRPPGKPVYGPDCAYRELGPTLQALRDEELHALYVDRKRRILARRQLTRGSDAFTVVDPRQIYRDAVGLGAAGVILAHNHPSGDPTPSAQDRDVTHRVQTAGRSLGIPLLDHLVIGHGCYRSMASDGLLPPWDWNEPSWTADGGGAAR